MMRSITYSLALIPAAHLFFGLTFVKAQAPPVELPRLVLTAKHRETVTPPGATSTTRLVAIRSSNTSVATAQPFRNNQVEIVALAPGKTTVEFFDAARGQKYIQPVWVEAPNKTGGGGPGYDPALTQLDQIIMLVNRSENAHTPNDAAAKISGVSSSNRSVATARTDPPRGIQIYSHALGDTWITFTDNTTGTEYQVHVWVRDKLNGPDTSEKGDPKAKKKENKVPIVPPIGTRKIDPCVVGNWVSETLGAPERRGGSGVRVLIDSMGRTTIDYSGMSPMIEGDSRGEMSGKAVVYIQTGSNAFRAWGIIENEVTFRWFNDGRATDPIPSTDGGWAVPANGPYTCTKDRLTTRKQVFRR